MSEGENYTKCYKALLILDSKYPQISQKFKSWYEEEEFEDDGLNDEFDNQWEDSMFIDNLKDNHNMNETQVQEIWNILNNAITNTVNTQTKEPEEIPTTHIPTTTSSQSSTSTPIPSSDNNNDILIEITRNGQSQTRMKKYKSPKYEDTPIVKIFNTEITKYDKKKIILNKNSNLKKQIKKQCEKLLPDKGNLVNPFKGRNQAQDILSVLLLGQKNGNYPLLLHLNDALMRCNLTQWLKQDRPSGFQISSAVFFDDYCINPHFLKFKTTKRAAITIEFLKTAIDSYQKRVLPSWRLTEKPAYILQENPLDFCDYMFEIARVIRNITKQSASNDSKILPIQLDFQIIHGKIKQNKPSPYVAELFDDSSDDSNNEEDEKRLQEYLHGQTAQFDDPDDDKNNDQVQIPSDITKILKSKKIDYKQYDKPLRSLIRITNDLTELVNNTRCQRSVFIVDRRGSAGSDKDKLFLFKPSKFGDFNSNLGQLIHASLHHNSIRSVLPRPKNKNTKKLDDYNARDGLRGQMLLISFHVISVEEIRCYLFFGGQCFRFYGEDLINVLPVFFENSKKTRKIMLTKLQKEPKWRQSFFDFCNTFIDKKFDLFYHSLTNELPRITVLKSKSKSSKSK